MDAILDSKRERDRKYQAERTKFSQEIGTPPVCKDPARRFECSRNPKLHLETYHPEIFNLPWAEYHHRLLDIGQQVVMVGGWFVFVVPRAGGKSKLSEGLCEWALFHGHKIWPVLIGATQPKSTARLKNLKTEWRINDLLYEDFPEIIHPIRALGRSARKAEGQKVNGAHTAIEWKTESVVLPTLDNETWLKWCEASKFEELPAKTFGSRIAVAGITGDIRGWSETTEEGVAIRPDLAIVDDPQTAESSRSFGQSTTRLEVLTKDIAYLAGPTTTMSVLMPATVINRNDMVHRILDRKTFPEWHGERHQMLKVMPANMELWDQYADIYRRCLQLDKPVDEANQFYLENQKAMDDGAAVTWPERFNDNEHSAIQNAMNLYYRDRASFQSEAQNDPIMDVDRSITICEPDEIVSKQNEFSRLVFPDTTQHVVSHIDVGQEVCWWGVGGFRNDFEGYIQGYGTFPDQERIYYQKSESLKSFKDVWPELKTEDQRIYAGLTATIEMLAKMDLRTQHGRKLKQSRITIDRGYKPEIVDRVIAESPHAALLTPIRGVGVRAKDTPFAERPRKDNLNETKGHYWTYRLLPDRSDYWTQADSNYWKSFVHLALCASPGSGGCLSIYKAERFEHQMFADHCNAEYPTRVKVGDNEKDEWDEKPGTPDNDFFDVVYNLCVGASMEGCQIPESHLDVIRPDSEDEAEQWGTEDV